MSATTTVRNRALLGAAIIAALSTSFAVAPAQAVTGPPDQAAAVKVSYVALGDSYAAGFGGGGYAPDDSCFTSPDGYAALLAADPGQVHSDLRGCTGATTAGVLEQLELGGPLSDDLDAAGAAIREAAPRATVFVTGYPLLFEPSIDPRVAAANEGVRQLNDVLEASAAGSGFVYVDVTAAFAGRGIGAADPWIIAAGPEAFHPNDAGYVAYADAIRAAGFSPAMG